MIVLDTNVVSEAMRPEPHAGVLAWLNRQTAETLYLSSVTLAELLFGISALPLGARKERLTQARERVLGLFTGRVLPFDHDAAHRYAEMAVDVRSTGRPLPVSDGSIAATAAARGFAVAIRNIQDFQATGVDLIGPWHTA